VTVDGITWPVRGAQVAVVQDGRVLVQFRPWPPGWELPGGHCDAGEDPPAAAAREIEEETGYSVRIGDLVGVYSWSGLRAVGDAVYLAEITGGRRRWSLESWAVRMVDPRDPPSTLFPWCRTRLRDAVARTQGAGPVHRVQPVTVRHILTFGTAWLRALNDRLRRRR